MPLAWFKQRTSPSARSTSATPSTSFDTWRDPASTQPTTEWERRLNAYAAKSARSLADAGVPLFRSEWARDGRGTYQDAFWLIALDVDIATRSYVQFQPAGPKRKSLTHPPLTARGEFLGWFRGEGLLLTKSGVLCRVDCEGWLKGFGMVNDKCMDMIFTDADRPEWALKSGDWGWNNRGRWRDDPKSNLRVHGVDAHVKSIRFERDYFRKGPMDDDARGTSAALSNYVKTNGSVRWPRGFPSTRLGY